MSYEKLPDLGGQPSMALFDLGLRVQNPIRHTYDENGEFTGRVQYRHFEAVSLAPGFIEIPGRPYTSELAESSTETKFVGTTIGVDYYSDPWGDLPSYMYSSGHIASFRAVNLASLLDKVGHVRTVDKPKDTDFAYRLPDIFHNEEPLPATVLIGEETIVAFLKKYIEITESEQPKKMASRQTEYLMPRVDWDLLSLMVTANLGGVAPDELPIPEEHRYRVLLDTGDTIAHGFMWDRKHLSGYKEKYENGRAEVEGSYEAWIDSPLYLAGHILQPTYAESLGYLFRAYGIAVEEFAEVIEQTWYAQNYHFEKGDEIPLDELYKHFHRDPDPLWAREFLASIPPTEIDYYRKTIDEVARMCARPGYFKNDNPYTQNI